MDKNKIYIIPDIAELDKYIEYAKDNHFHFEYNDFFIPDKLDEKGYVDSVVDLYNSKELPSANTLHGSFLDITINSSDRAIREHSMMRLRESMDIASRLRAKAVIIHTNYIPNFVDDSYIDTWIESYEAAIRTLLDEYSDISIYMENMFDMNPAVLGKLAERLVDESRFGICLDYAHINVFGQCEILEWMETLGKYVKHIHINDNNLIKDQHLAIGDGLIDYEVFMDYYNQYFPEATVLLEVRGMDKIVKSVKSLGF